MKHYYEHFSHQPYPLFSRPELQPWATSDRPPDIVLWPMLALSLRIMTDPGPSVDDEVLQVLYEHAWRKLVDAYSAFSFDESYY